MNPVARYLERRKLRKRYKELRVTVRDAIASDNDIFSEEEMKCYTAFQEELRTVSPTDERKIGIMEKKLLQFHDRRSFFYLMRGWLDVLAVALTVAFGIRALLLQPFKIPTSSMQPTMFGIHYVDREESRPFRGPLTNLFLPLGASEAKLKTQEDGLYYEGFKPVSRTVVSLIPSVFHPSDFYFTGAQVLQGRMLYMIPGDNPQDLIYRYLDRNPENSYFEKDTVVFDGFLSSGDHLFVDRMSLHLVPLRRGEIFIFNTEGLSYRGMSLPGYYYVKRLVGMPGDTLKIRDNILYIRPKGDTEFHRADELAPKLKKIYSFKGGYQGHKAIELLADGAEFNVPEESYFALGDNTNNSLDSRYWNVVPRRNVIGRALNIFWPVSRRWGFCDTQDPLDCDTVFPEKSTQPTAMRLQ